MAVKLYCIFGLIFTPTILLGQQSRPPVVNFTPKNYGTQQTPENYCIFQDSRGFIYSGNSGGVLLYDGSNWDFIPVQNGSYVTAIDQDSKGIIYVGTSGGEFGKLMTTPDGKLKYVSLKNWFGSKKLYLGWIQKMFCVGQDIYIYTPENLFFIHQKNVQIVPTQNSFQLIHKVGDKIYARERGVGLIEVNKTSKSVLSTISEFVNYGILGIVDYNAHHLLVVTQEKGLWLFNKENKQTLCLNSDSVSLKKHLIIGAIKLNDGLFAANSLSSGIILFNKDGKSVGFLNKSSGLRVNDIKQIIQDKQHNLWLAMSNGIGLINYGSFLHFYDDETGLLGGIECVTRSKNTIYVGTSEGLFSESMNDPSRNFTQINDINGQVWDIDNYQDKVVVATDDGIYLGKKETFTKIAPQHVNSLTIVEDNKLIAAGKDGVYYLTLPDGKLISEQYFESPVTRCLSVRKDPSSTSQHTKAWLGTIGHGVYEINLNGDQINLELHHNLDDHSLAFIRPVTINKQIYFCTSTGLRKLTFKEKKPFFDYAEIFPELDVTRVTDIKQNGKRVWVCAENKIFHYDENKKEPVTTPFLPIDMGRINNLFVEDDKTCWIAAADGLVRYTETYDKRYNTSFDVVVRKVMVNNDSVIHWGNWSKATQFINKQPTHKKFELAYKFNTYEFTISALYFEGMDKIQYTHLLEGHDEEWSSWSNENKIKYSNLREGDYVLKIKAKNVYGFESNVQSFAFKVLPPWYRTNLAYLLYCFTALLLFYFINRILSYRLKQKNLHLEHLVKKRTEEIERKNIELNSQNIQIKHQKQEITDSINYAQKIQEAMLPFDQELKKDIPDSFILFKPKDIVSGDFYWYGKFANQSVIICADCTGHGVPGAFMSMLCVDKLNQIIPEKKVLMPNKILEETNKGIKKSLGQSDEQNLKTKDGMDAAVVTIDWDKKILFYAGANRPLWLLRDGIIQEFKANKYAVGGFTPEEQVYEMHSIPIVAGDRFYMSTDGYADQFGGPKGKKIMVKAFKELLTQNNTLTFEDQCQKLDSFVEAWKNHQTGSAETIEQVDDICVIGFKL